MKNNINNMNFNFLKEQPLKSLDDQKKIQFGHDDIANTLTSIIRQCATPFTIALFGKWGSGKSTIAYKVKSNLDKHNIPVVVFDVWKHEGDSLRRSFLKECYNSFRAEEKQSGRKILDKDYELDERVDHGVTRTIRGALVPNKEIVKHVKNAAKVILPVIAVATVGAWYFDRLADLWKILAPVLTSSIVTTFIVSVVSNILTTEPTTFSSDRLEDPHEFQDEFGKMIQALHPKKALIVFDNIDRVMHKKAVETLSTIKTFLEPKDEELKKHEIVFLIPCDDQAIREHLRAVYDREGGDGPFDPDEFLKKFFNTVLWIPDFIDSELISFAQSCLQATQVTSLDDPTLAWLITKAYRDNPRQIIQFVNILLSNYLLIKNREGDGKDFEEDFAGKHNREICLFLLLVHQYPDVIAALRREKVIALNKIPESLDINDIKQVDSFKRFVGEVDTEVAIENLRPYYTLRRSKYEKQFPGIEQLFVYLQDNQLEQAKDIIGGYKDIENKISNFGLAIKDGVDQINSPTSLAHFINSLLSVLNDIGIHLDYSRNSELFNAIKIRVADKLHVMSPVALYEGILTQCPTLTRQLVNLWENKLEAIVADESLRKTSRRFILSLFDVFTRHPNIVKSQSQKIQSILATNFADDIEILKKCVTSEEIQKQFLSKNYVSDFVDSITDKDVTIYDSEADEKSREPIKLAMLNRFNADFFDDALMKAVVTKLLALSNAKTAQAWNPKAPEDWESLFLSFKDFVSKYDLSSLSNAPELVQFADAIVAAFNKIPDWDNKRMVMPLISILKSYLPDPKLAELRAIEVQYLTHTSLESLDYYLKSLGDNKTHVKESEHLAIFQQRSMADRKLLDYFYSKLTTDTKSKWLLALLDSNPTEAISKITDLKYKIPTKEDVLNKILQLAVPAPEPLKSQYYEIVNAMRCDNSQETEKVFVDQLKTLLTTSDQASQKAGYNAFSQADYLDGYKREVTKAILEYLKTLPDTQKYQKYSLESLFTLLDQLAPEERGEITYFCFEHLILKSNNVEAVTLGFKFLSALTPSYEDRKPNFDDVRRFVEQQPDSAIKTAIIEGLKRLRPGKTNKEFWGWVDTLE